MNKKLYHQKTPDDPYCCSVLVELQSPQMGIFCLRDLNE